MAALGNPRWELFAQGIAQGKAQGTAYIEAGYKTNPKVAGVSSSQLLSHPSNGPLIRARIAELQAQKLAIADRANERAIDTLEISREWVLRGLKENAERCMQAVAMVDEKGNPIGEFKHQAQAANRAYELIGKEFGMFVDRSMDVPNPDADVNEMTRDEKLAEARRLVEELGIPVIGGKRGVGG